MAANSKRMRIVTWNVNGLESAVREGLIDVIRRFEADVLMLQDLRCDAARTRELLAPVLDGYSLASSPSSIAGRSGVAILALGEHDEVQLELGEAGLDREGRLVAIRARGIQFWSCYVPSGSSKARLAVKHDYLRRVLERALGTGMHDAVVLGSGIHAWP